jgi:hypothetical protein
MLQQDVSNIYWKAMKNLDTELIETFSQKFCLYKINIDTDESKLNKSDLEIME